MDTAIDGAGGLTGWAQADLGTAQLGDDRLVKRAILVVERMSADPQASIYRACKSRAEFEGARRLLDNEKAKPELLCQAMRRSTRHRLSDQGINTVLMMHDTSSLNFSSHKATKGLGPLGGGNGTKGRGFWCHTCFAVTPSGVPIGVLGQLRYARKPGSVGSRHSRHTTARENKESARWEELDGQVRRSMPSDLHTISICDREADIMSYLAQPRAANANFIVRAAQDRRLVDGGHKLFGHMQTQPVVDRTIIAVRQHPKHTVRYALLTLQYCQVTFAGITHGPKEDRCGPLTLTAIRVAEVNPPKDAKPIGWVLLTDLPINSLEDAWRCVRYYTYRWLIERYHYTLKSGCRIEDCQVRNRSRLECVLVLYSVVAWRLLWITYLARANPGLPASTVFSHIELLAIWLLHHDDGSLPHGDETLAEAVHMVAVTGGYKPETAKDPPGVIAILTGLKAVHTVATVLRRFIE